MKIVKGDKVVVIAGKDKGKEGVVQAVYPKVNKVVVEGVILFWVKDFEQSIKDTKNLHNKIQKDQLLKCMSQSTLATLLS